MRQHHNPLSRHCQPCQLRRKTRQERLWMVTMMLMTRILPPRWIFLPPAGPRPRSRRHRGHPMAGPAGVSRVHIVHLEIVMHPCANIATYVYQEETSKSEQACSSTRRIFASKECLLTGSIRSVLHYFMICCSFHEMGSHLYLGLSTRLPSYPRRHVWSVLLKYATIPHYCWERITRVTCPTACHQGDFQSQIHPASKQEIAIPLHCNPHRNPVPTCYEG